MPPMPPIGILLSTTVLAWDARVVPVDLAYVIFIDFLALGVLRFCFLLLSNVQFLVLVNLPPGRSHAGGISSRHSRRRYPFPFGDREMRIDFNLGHAA